MGHDEHGPAYPEPPQYRCPICNGDKDRFFTCEYPGCPDGRDRGHPYARLVETYEGPAPSKGGPWSTILTVAFTALVVTCLFFLFSKPAPAMNHGFNPDDKTVQWFESKIRPDSPPNSCCGKGDAYPVARVRKNTDHTWSVWLADGSAIKYPDGTHREYFDMGTEIIVPDNKVNPPDDDLDNPTDVGWIFMRVSTPTDVGTIYCLIIHPEGN